VKKLLLIAWKEITQRFTDPFILLLAIATPLTITALIKLSFGDVVLDRGTPDTKIAVGIVNQDRGGPWGNFGQTFVRVIIPGPETVEPPNRSETRFSQKTWFLSNDWHFALFAGRELKDEAQARRLVEREELTAALLIPPNFSQALATEGATVKVYINGRDSVRGIAFQITAETLANMISTSEVTVRTTVKALSSYPEVRTQLHHGWLNEPLTDLAIAAVQPEANPIKVQRISNVSSLVRLELTHYLAAAIAVLWIGFTGLVGSASLLQERAQGTLQRMYITPTRMEIILGGKTLGTYLLGLLQMAALIGGMDAVERILSSGPRQGPQINLLGLSMLALAVVTAATGFGVAIAGLARTYTQAANYGRAALMLMALVGGLFLPVELFPQPLQALSRVTFHYWALDGYWKLALGGNALSILPHALILGAMGLLFFALGGWLLRRRLGFS